MALIIRSDLLWAIVRLNVVVLIVDWSCCSASCRSIDIRIELVVGQRIHLFVSRQIRVNQIVRSVLGQSFGNIVSAVGVVVQFDANLFVLFLLDFLTLVVALRDVVRHQMLLGRLEGSGLGLGQNEVGNNLVLPSRMGTLSFRLFVFDVLRHETGLVGVQTRQIWIISVLVLLGSDELPEVQQLSLVQLG